MLENAFDDRRIFDAGDNPDGATSVSRQASISILNTRFIKSRR